MLNAEQIHKITSISLKMVEVVILSENSCQLFSSHFKISQVLNGTTPKKQHRNRGPK